jgi:hypothetical protein
MSDFDAYSIIEHVMNDTLDDLQRRRRLCELQLHSVNYVLVLAYGSSSCRVILKISSLYFSAMTFYLVIPNPFRYLLLQIGCAVSSKHRLGSMRISLHLVLHTSPCWTTTEVKNTE